MITNSPCLHLWSPGLLPLAPWPEVTSGGQTPSSQPGHGWELLRAGHAVAHCPGIKNILLRFLFVPNTYTMNVYLFAIAIVLFAFKQKDCANKCTMYLLTAFSLRPKDLPAMMMKVCLKMMLWRPGAVKMSHCCENCEKTLRHTSFPDEKLELLPMDMLPVELPPLKLSFSEESFLLASRSAAATSILSLFASLWWRLLNMIRLFTYSHSGLVWFPITKWTQFDTRFDVLRSKQATFCLKI